MMAMTLHEIDSRLASILEYEPDEYVDTETGEMVCADEVALLEMERADKIEGWGLWIKNQYTLNQYFDRAAQYYKNTNTDKKKSKSKKEEA